MEFIMYMILLPLIVLTNFSHAQVIPQELMSNLGKIEQLNQMREKLAQSIDIEKKADMNSFNTVCKPVGIQMRALSKDQPWTLKQVSNKYRNPQNKASEVELSAINKFRQDTHLLSFFQKQNEEEGAGIYYFRRITVQQSCLKCHGSKAQRPSFVVEKYPNDLAFDFKAGGLRGIYSLFLPKQN